MIPFLVQEDILTDADFFFAKTLVPKAEEEVLLLLAYLLASARSGHLCIKIVNQKVFPSLAQNYQEELEKKLLKGKELLPSSLFESEGSPLYVTKDTVALIRNHKLEKLFMQELRRLQNTPLYFPISEGVLSDLLTSEQKEAASKALVFPISILSGGPGTGKSFTAVEIIRLFLNQIPQEERKDVTIKIGAPTGKAAALLEKSIVSRLDVQAKITCGTIHSFLQTSPFVKTIYADLFLIDEASMIDADLFIRFLQALQGGGRLLLMGDKDQLPPVEAGGFFSDLLTISSGEKIPSTLLTESRRMENRALYTLSQNILSGEVQKVLSHPFIKLIEEESVFALQKNVVNMCVKAFDFTIKEKILPEDMLRQLETFALLSCMKKGPLGSKQLNTLILNSFLEKGKGRDFLACPILIRSNDIEKKLMNGEIGLLVAKPSSFLDEHFCPEDRAYFFSKNEGGMIREISAAELPYFEIGYCLSIHKSQGSEYEKVLILTPKGSERFGKEILYTAVTRAKKEATIFASEQTLRQILQQSSKRISTLVD